MVSFPKKDPPAKLPLWGFTTLAKYGGGLLLVAAATKQQAVDLVTKKGFYPSWDLDIDKPIDLGISRYARPCIVDNYLYIE